MALVRLTAGEIADFQTVMRAIATNSTVACRNAALVGNAYTRWMIASGVAAADPIRDEDFDASFFSPALDVLYGQAVTIFRSDICDSLSALEQRQLEQAAAWAAGGSAGFGMGVVGVAFGVVGLGLAAWALWGRGKRR